MVLATLFQSAAEPLQPVREGIRKRPLIVGEGLQADEIFFEEGVTTSGHAHDLEQAAYQVAGEFEVTLGDERRHVKPGDAYRIPAGTPHSVRCLRQGSYLLITARGGHVETDPAHNHERHEPGDHDHHDHEHGHHDH